MLQDELLTIEEVAAYLKLMPQTIYKWAQKGKLPGAKFGKEWRFKRSDIVRWVDDHMNHGAKRDAPLKEGGRLAPLSDSSSEVNSTKPALVQGAKEEPKAAEKRRSSKRSREAGPESN